jgi:hypothetical protein
MRTASAHIYKLKAENRGRTYKIQDTNHRLVASPLYRGAAGCPPLNTRQIKYTAVCRCSYLDKPIVYVVQNACFSGSIVNGGDVNSIATIIIDGQDVTLTIPPTCVIDGGVILPPPCFTGRVLDGGNYNTVSTNGINGQYDTITTDPNCSISGGIP